MSILTRRITSDTTPSHQEKPRPDATARIRPSTLPGLWLALVYLTGGALAACGQASDGPEVALTTIQGERCVDGAVACGESCVKLASSAENCSACGLACNPGEICDRSSCKPAAAGCSSGLLLCGEDCIDASKDRDHCGSCDQTCPSGADCKSANCVCPGTETACGDACVELSTDAKHCGACDVACVDTQTCESGSCQCPANTTLCGATCADPTTDAQNCGGCGIACTGGQVCEESACACPAGDLFCSDRCVDPSNDPQNCGGCGTACVGGQVCDAGSCECPSGQELCDGKCTDTQTDSAHCGSCGTACGLGDGCSVGACQSGALGDDGCQGLAHSLDITQVSVYQTVESVIARNGQVVTAPAPGIVAKRPTLFRVFVTPGADWTQREVSARLHLESGTTLTTAYATSKLSPAAASTEDGRATTFEFTVPAEQITADTQYSLELVECGAPGPGDVTSARFPGSAGAELGAIDTGGLHIHIVPMRSNGLLPDTSDSALALYRSAFLDTYPINSITLDVGNPLDIADPQDWNNNLDTLRALRQSDAPAPEIYYYGMLKPAATLRAFCGNGCTAGVGYVPNGRLTANTRAAMGLAYADTTSAFTMLHEVAHNHGRAHAPCVEGGTITGVDPNYPFPDGTTGGYGYDKLSDKLLPPTETDVMGYCRNQWLSAYTYGGLLSAVMTVNQVQASEIVSQDRIGDWRVLLLDDAHGARWGQPIPGPEVATGEAESALVLDASGVTLETVSVYRTHISDLNAFSLQVPEPKPGWDAIQVTGAAPLRFSHAP